MPLSGSFCRYKSRQAVDPQSRGQIKRKVLRLRSTPKGLDDGCVVGSTMSCRIRHCISCPHCRTRYIIGFSPYGNGSYLLSNPFGSLEEYLLYCSCGGVPVPSRWRDSEIKACEVSGPVYRRGYGSPEEVTLLYDQRGD